MKAFANYYSVLRALTRLPHHMHPRNNSREWYKSSIRSLDYAHIYIDISIHYNGISMKTKVKRIKNISKLDDFRNKLMKKKLQRAQLLRT